MVFFMASEFICSILIFNNFLLQKAIEWE